MYKLHYNSIKKIFKEELNKFNLIGEKLEKKYVIEKLEYFERLSKNIENKSKDTYKKLLIEEINKFKNEI